MYLSNYDVIAYLNNLKLKTIHMKKEKKKKKKLF